MAMSNGVQDAAARGTGDVCGGGGALERQMDSLYRITLVAWIGAPASLVTLLLLFTERNVQEGLVNVRSTLGFTFAFGVVSSVLYAYGKLSPGTGLYVAVQ